jgi:hypothetical protein
MYENVSPGERLRDSEDIFPLGCYDHGFSDQSSFPLIMFFQLAVLTIISELLVKYMPIAPAESNCDSPCNDICFLFVRTYVPGVPNMINYIFSMHLQLSNGKQLFLQQETMPYGSGFPHSLPILLL